jgi:transposase
VLLSLMKPTPMFRLLNTVVGIGPVLAIVIALEIGDISRFPSGGDFVSYCRLVDSKKTSNNKKKGEGNRKNDNPYLA